MSSESVELELDDAFNILSNSRRRYILYYLYTRDGPATIDELAGQIAAWENDTPVDELDDTARRRVYVSLYQTHLPKLDDFDIAAYDRDEGTVELTDRADQIIRYLPVDESGSQEFARYYVAVTAGAIALILGVGVGVVPAAVAAIAVAAALVGLVGYQYLVADDESTDFLDLEDLE